MSENEKKQEIPEIKDWSGATKFVADLVNGNKELAHEAMRSNETLASEIIAESNRNADRFHRNARHWMIACIVAVVLLFATNACWLYVFQSYDFVSQDGEGINSINTGNQEEIDYGAESQTEKEQE